MQGRLIVLEGIEGSGKTTQIQRLYQWLQALLGHRFGDAAPPLYLTRQPGGTATGQSIRQLLLASDGADLGSTTELLLYAADRAQHVEQLLRPKLAAGGLVLCDRYTDSTVAYQGYGRGLSLELIHQLNQIATGGLTSDLTLWLQLDVATGLERMRARGRIDRIEQAGLAFHQRVHQGFAAQVHRENFVTVDGSGSQSAVAERMQTAVLDYLERWYGRF